MMLRTSAGSTFVIKKIPSAVGSFPAALIWRAPTSTYACFRTSLNSGYDTAFFTANRTNGFSRYLNAASRLSLTDCMLHEHITRTLVNKFTLLRLCCDATIAFLAQFWYRLMAVMLL